MTRRIQIHKIHSNTSDPQPSRLYQSEEHHISHGFLQVDQAWADSGYHQRGYEDQAGSGSKPGDAQVDEEEEEAADHTGVDGVGWDCVVASVLEEKSHREEIVYQRNVTDM